MVWRKHTILFMYDVSVKCYWTVKNIRSRMFRNFPGPYDSEACLATVTTMCLTIVDYVLTEISDFRNVYLMDGNHIFWYTLHCSS